MTRPNKDDTPPIILGQGDYRTAPEPNALAAGCLWSIIGLAVIGLVVGLTRILF
jgi:hypothetical protein